MGEVIIPVNLDTKSFDAQIEKLEDDLDRLEQEYEAVSKAGTFDDEQLTKYRAEIEKTKNKIIGLRKEQDKITKKDISSIQGELSGIGDKIGKITKKAAKWALAIFSVRSAYSFVRNAVSRISEQDEQLKANIEYMKNAIAYTIEPLVRKIVDWAYKILQYIGYIIKSWTNKNIFENANNSLKNSNKSAKELKKTLASFDEINMLGEQKTGTTTPNIDLTNLDDIQPPAWVKWIADNKELVEGLGIALGTILGASAVGKILGNIGKLLGISGGAGLIGLSELLLAIAAPILMTIAIKGVVDVINQMNDIKDAMDDTTSAMDNVIEKYDEVVKKVNDNWESLSPEELEKYFNSLSGQIEQYKFSIEGLKKQKENIWWNKEERDKIDAQIKDYEEKIKKLTSEKNTITFKTKIDTSELTKFVKEISGHSNLWLMQNWSSVLSKYSLIKSAKGSIIYPRLASGGLVNYPGRGVMYHGANIGEKGTEAILPLTDSQQMQLLGKAIADNLNLNATIPVYVGNRQVAREIRKIDIEDSFARNGG